MSRSTRYRVVPSSINGRFAVYDTAGGSVVHDGFRDRSLANARARGLNEAVTPKASGYFLVRCPECNTARLVQLGKQEDCPTCARERARIEARIDWEATRRTELEEARRSIEADIEAREFAVVGERWDGME